MLDKIGIVGVLGVLLMFGGIGVIAYVDLYLAAGASFIVSGFGLVIFGVMRGIFRSLGMNGMP